MKRIFSGYVITSFVELFIYYLLLILFSICIFQQKPVLPKLGLSLLFFVPLFFILLYGSDTTVMLSCYIVPAAELLLIRLCFTKAPMRDLFFTLLFLYILNTALTEIICLLYSFTIEQRTYIELAIHIATALICLVCCCTRLRTAIRGFMQWTSYPVKLLILAITLLGCFLAVPVVDESNFSQASNLLDIVRVVLILLVVILAIAIPVMVTSSIRGKYFKNQYDNFKEQLNIQSQHYELLSHSNMELRRFRHDFKNMCIGLGTLISQGKNKEAMEMLEKQQSITAPRLLVFDTGNGIVDALLTDKQKTAAKAGITISFEGAVPSAGVKPVDLCVLFGNTLDNALEACRKLPPDSNAMIRVVSRCSSGFLFIRISNPVAQQVDISQGRPLTTKADKSIHGFGLESLEKTVKAYHGQTDYQSSDREFTVEIEMELSSD